MLSDNEVTKTEILEDTTYYIHIFQMKLLISLKSYNLHIMFYWGSSDYLWLQTMTCACRENREFTEGTDSRNCG